MLGRTTFQKGLQKYVKDMAFKVAEPKDFYRNIQEAADEDNSLPRDVNVEDVINSWIDQPGYPLLTVMRNYDSNEIVVNQQRFLSSRGEVDNERITWYIPLSINTARNPDMNNTMPRAWLKQGTRELVIRTEENLTWTSDDWVLFNVQQTGYYRVNYDLHNWKLLANDLYGEYPCNIGTINRAQLIDDSFSLAYSDNIQFTVALDIIKYVKFEREYSVWVTANRHLLSMDRKLQGDSYELYFGRFLQHLTDGHFERLDVFEDNLRDCTSNTFLRPIIVHLACRSGSGKCLTATRIMVTAEALTGHVLAPRERPSVYYCHGLKNADENTFQYFWKKLKSLTNDQERKNLVHSIGCYHNSDSVYSLLLETVDLNATDVFYTNYERHSILWNIIRNGDVKVVMRFLRENHNTIARTYTYNFRMENNLKEIADCLPEEYHQEYTEILEMLAAEGHISRSLMERCIIDMENHRIWVNENKIKIENWIAGYFQPKLENSGMEITVSTLVVLIAIGHIFFPIY
uniref:ERAP1-like C-terminal domain-containing protein n=1 Tax=Phlebotomus papatasi TaxID=29031 RepID=A0A1B0D9N6_PHLPP